MPSSNLIKKFVAISFLSLVISACGGGGGSDSSTPTPTPTPQPADPTATVSFTASFGETNTDLTVANLTGSENVDSWSFNLNGVTGHVVVNGENVPIENGTADVSSYASKDFQLMLNHDTAGTYNIAVTGFTVDGKSYDLSENQDITFTAPAVVTGRVDITVQTAGTGILAGNTTQSTQQEIVKGQVNEFLLRDLTANFYTYSDGVAGLELDTTVALELTDGKQSLSLAVGDYIVEVTGVANINGTDEIFSSSRKFSVTQGGLASVGFALIADNITSEEVDSMNQYDSTFNTGDTKFITLSDIMANEVCVLKRNLNNFVLKASSTLTVDYKFLCLSEQNFTGWTQTVNQYVQTTFNSDAMSDPVIYDVNDTTLAYGVHAPLAKGSTTLNVTFGNVSYSDTPLEVTITGQLLNNYTLYSDNLNLTIQIIE